VIFAVHRCGPHGQVRAGSPTPWVVTARVSPRPGMRAPGTYASWNTSLVMDGSGGVPVLKCVSIGLGARVNDPIEVLAEIASGAKAALLRHCFD